MVGGGGGDVIQRLVAVVVAKIVFSYSAVSNIYLEENQRKTYKKQIYKHSINFLLIPSAFCYYKLIIRA